MIDLKERLQCVTLSYLISKGVVEVDNDTYIRLYRSFLNWQFYSDRNVKDVYLHCLLSANFKRKNWKGGIIGRGSFVTTYKKLKLKN